MKLASTVLRLHSKADEASIPDPDRRQEIAELYSKENLSQKEQQRLEILQKIEKDRGEESRRYRSLADRLERFA